MPPKDPLGCSAAAWKMAVTSWPGFARPTGWALVGVPVAITFCLCCWLKFDDVRLEACYSSPCACLRRNSARKIEQRTQAKVERKGSAQAAVNRRWLKPQIKKVKRNRALLPFVRPSIASCLEHRFPPPLQAKGTRAVLFLTSSSSALVFPLFALIFASFAFCFVIAFPIGRLCTFQLEPCGERPLAYPHCHLHL